MVRAVVTREDSDEHDLLELRAALLELAPQWDPEIMAEVDAIAVRSGDLGSVDSLPLPLVRVPPVDAPLRVLAWYLVRRAIAGVAARIRAAIRVWRAFDDAHKQASLAGDPDVRRVKGLFDSPKREAQESSRNGGACSRRRGGHVGPGRPRRD